MRLVRTAIIAGVATAALAGAAFAAGDDNKVMLIAMPDGSVQHVRYQGNVAPQVVLVAAPAPVSLFDAAFGPDSAFAEMERISAMMEARTQAMMQQAAAMRAQMPATPAERGPGIVMTNAQGQPVGVMHYSFVSSTTSADGCTRTVSYSSDGAPAAGQGADQPRVIRTSSGSCGSAAPAPSSVTPTGTAPKAKPAPKIIPVSVPAELKAFTPSRT
ncbi:hypothetical protein GG804_01060 [Sphingomonas histidinilytica]|jgi:hypothetical protein|uniref:hypothetical protein n=1 Tax=Rhizorhabdus histidinilytica TaxID=439228 RepID=UPI000F7BA0AA|nr:hypothetical protein [Rhizorhabdus histidinilytica]MBO9375347.1 hypothetical protein [Rhizorhabdus histidinilytica]QEH77285.1 hypothetical protein EIK56_03525 [Sphingomonas sp. C8-2]